MATIATTLEQLRRRRTEPGLVQPPMTPPPTIAAPVQRPATPAPTYTTMPVGTPQLVTPGTPPHRTPGTVPPPVPPPPDVTVPGTGNPPPPSPARPDTDLPGTRPPPTVDPSRFRDALDAIARRRPGAEGPDLQRPDRDLPGGGAGGAVPGTHPFGPGDDLRFTQIDPVGSARQNRLAGLTTGAAEALAGGPNLREAAGEHLRLFEEQSQPAFERALQDVGRRAGAWGRLGAGMTTSELGDVTTLRERAIGQERRRLAAELAEAEEGQRQGRVGTLGALEGQIYGQEAGARGELRGERGYQSGVAREAQEDRIRQRMLEEALLQGQFGRQAEAARLQLGASGLYGGQAGESSDAVSRLLEQLALMESMRAGGRRRTGGGYIGEAPDLPG
jgi:hypothetical protein